LILFFPGEPENGDEIAGWVKVRNWLLTFICIWMMATFFQTVPIELEDAARMDGCSRLGILFRVVMPISVPGLVSTAMFTFLLAWDELFYALIFANKLATKTAPVAMAEFIGRYGHEHQWHDGRRYPCNPAPRDPGFHFPAIYCKWTDGGGGQRLRRKRCNNSHDIIS